MSSSIEWAEMEDLAEILMKGAILHEVALEMATGDVPLNKRDAGHAGAIALAALTNAIVRVAAYNSNPRQILEYVVGLIDAADPSVFVETDVRCVACDHTLKTDVRCVACDHTLADHIKPQRSDGCPPTACLRRTGDGSCCSCERYEAPSGR